MSLLIYLLLLLSNLTTLQAQKQGQALIDSLLAELPKAKEDTNKVNLLSKISSQYIEIKPTQGIIYGEQGSSLAENLQFKKGKAECLNACGLNYCYLSNYPIALECFLKSLKINEAIRYKRGMAESIGNIGLIYDDQMNYSQALEYYFKALSIFEELGDKIGMAINIGNIGVVYHSQGNYPKAVEYHLKALKIDEALGNKVGMAACIGNIGEVYQSQGNYPKALEYYLKTLSIDNELGSKSGIATNIGNIGQLYLKMAKESGVNTGLKKEYITKAIHYLLSAIRLFSSISDLNSYQIYQEVLSEAYELNVQFDKALVAFKEHAKYKDSVFNQEKGKELNSKELSYAYAKREDSIRLEAEKKDSLHAATLSYQKNMTNASLVGVVLLLLVALVSINGYRQKRKANAAITHEKQRSDALLLNILPEEIAEELKNKGAADAKHFDEVTVLFTDFVNFTQHSERLSPTELVAELNSCFTSFDEIIARNGLEKIKTIGDAYMAVCGLPVSDSEHGVKTVRAALEIRDYINQRNQANGDGFEIRIGLHSGPVVAGIIGVKKFAYDIWGDTVNFAARMESSGESGKVNISESTYQLVKDQFAFEHRGKIKAKNKGEVEMYFVENKNV